MKPAAFDYVRIDTVDEALDHLAELGDDARVLAGGQSLLPILNMRLAQPRVLLDISRCEALNYVRATSKNLAIGAATTQGTLERRKSLSTEIPLLAQALPHISHFQIRNRGTVCGSVAHADPSAELPLCLAALGGEVVLRSRKGMRVLGAEAFHLGLMATARRPDELIVEVRFPLGVAATYYAFEEFSMRHGDYAIVAAAAIADARSVHLAIGGVTDRPALVHWDALDDSTLPAAINDFAWSLDARDDALASAKARRHWVRQLASRAIARARLETGVRS